MYVMTESNKHAIEEYVKFVCYIRTLQGKGSLLYCTRGF